MIKKTDYEVIKRRIRFKIMQYNNHKCCVCGFIPRVVISKNWKAPKDPWDLNSYWVLCNKCYTEKRRNWREKQGKK